MVKNTIELDEEQVAFFKKICRLNGNEKPKTQDAVLIGLEIAEECVRFMNYEEFKELTNKNK